VTEFICLKFTNIRKETQVNYFRKVKIMRTRTETVFETSEWDDLVEATYGRPYTFQQQNDCQERGVFRFTVPGEADDFDNATIPEVVNGKEMGVSFVAWLARDPKTPLADEKQTADHMIRFHTRLWWERNFYPDILTVSNDLHAKGLLKAGEYCIDIDW